MVFHINLARKIRMNQAGITDGEQYFNSRIIMHIADAAHQRARLRVDNLSPEQQLKLYKEFINRMIGPDASNETSLLIDQTDSDDRSNIGDKPLLSIKQRVSAEVWDKYYTADLKQYTDRRNELQAQITGDVITPIS
ncbi:MAG: hypothetical protein ABI220_01970 [Candidatus Saccharimonadales bacterium]